MTLPTKPASSKASALKIWAEGHGSNGPFGYKLLRLVLRFVLICVAEFNKNALSLRSAALTYTVLLSLVPILAMSTAIMKGLGGDAQLRKAAYSYIDSLTARSESSVSQTPVTEVRGVTPALRDPASLTGHLHSAVDQLFDYVEKTNFATLGSIGVIGILLSVVLVFSYIEEAMNDIWQVSRGRSLLRKIADYLTLLIILPISINIAFAAGALLQSPALIARVDMFIPFAWMQTLLLKAMPVVIITLTFYLMYIFFPNTKVQNLPALFGAFLAALLWMTVQNIYIFLQIGVSNYNAIYGSFATLPLFLVWIYLGWLFILSGAQVAYACQTFRNYRLLPQKTVPSLRLAAAFDAMDCIIASYAQGKAIDTRGISDCLPEYAPILLTEIVAQLCAAGLLHVSRTENRLVPASPDHSDIYQRIVAEIFGTETVETAGGRTSTRAIEAAIQTIIEKPC